MKYILRFQKSLLVLMATALVAFAACSSDDEETLLALTGSPIGVKAHTVSSLIFTWDEVENASQYGYRLLDSLGNVVAGGVTTELEVQFTGLADDADYTFELTSFAAYGSSSYSNAEAVTYCGHTDKIVPLATPVLTAEVAAERINASWDAVDNADKYYVSILLDADTVKADTITATTYAYTGEVGQSYTLCVSADTEEEAYSQSEWARVEDLVPVKASRQEAWRVAGSFYDAGVYSQTSTRTLVAYDDGTYELLDWIYEGSGCNLEFSATEGGEIEVLNGNGTWGDYVSVAYYPGGYNCYIYPVNGYSYFSVAECKLSFYAYSYASGTSTFTWNAADVVYATPHEIWRVAGSFYDAGVYSQTTTRTLVAYSDGTYELLDWVYEGSGCNLKFSVNDSGEMEILNGSGTYGDYVLVEYYPGYSCYCYTISGYSSFSETDCGFWFYAYGSSSGYSQFTWNAADVVRSE